MATSTPWCRSSCPVSLPIRNARLTRSSRICRALIHGRILRRRPAMRVELTEVLWFEQHVLSLSELADISGLPRAVLEELLDCGAIAPLEAVPAALPVALPVTELRFGASALRAARTAHRLRVDVERDIQALPVPLCLVATAEQLEAQLPELRLQLLHPGHQAQRHGQCLD